MNKHVVLWGLLGGLFSLPTMAAPVLPVTVPSMSPDEARQLMNRLYGHDAYWAKHDCWLGEAADQTRFCMRLAQVHQVGSGAARRHYVQTAGASLSEVADVTELAAVGADEGRDFNLGHSDGGGVGLFVLGGDGRSVHEAVAAMLYPAGNGAAPAHMALWPLSGQGDFAWFDRSGGQWQGVLFERPQLYWLRHHQVYSLADDLPSLGEGNQGVEYDYRLDTRANTQFFYPMVVTERRPDGQERVMRAEFDVRTHSYRIVPTAP